MTNTIMVKSTPRHRRAVGLPGRAYSVGRILPAAARPPVAAGRWGCGRCSPAVNSTDAASPMPRPKASRTAVTIRAASAGRQRGWQFPAVWLPTPGKQLPDRAGIRRMTSSIARIMMGSSSSARTMIPPSSEERMSNDSIMMNPNAP